MSDDAEPVRAEDAFDVEALQTWLAEHGVGGGAEGPESSLSVTQFRGGASNLTYLVRFGDDGDRPALVLRRPPTGVKARGAHDMAREFHVQSGLASAYPHVPAMIAFCDDEGVLGAPFYVMEHVEGMILRADLPAAVSLDADDMAALCWTAIDGLVALHAVDPAATGLADLGRGAGYVERQVAGWSKRYRAARTWNVPDFERVMTWLERHRPDDVASRVIHNDYRFDNLVLDGWPLRVVGVLDWELATVGDPLMDLGCALAYWVQADDEPTMQMLRRQPTHRPGAPTRAEVVGYYARRTGLAVDDWTFYEVFGLFRLAVILQQIYYRFHLGQTHNPRFARFWIAADYLDWRCRRIIAAGRG